jgi:hypothetical protein
LFSNYFFIKGAAKLALTTTAPKYLAKKLAFLTQNKAKLCKILIMTLFVLKKNGNFFAENCQKSPKIVIITSTQAAAIVYQADQNLRVARFFMVQKIRKMEKYTK